LLGYHEVAVAKIKGLTTEVTGITGKKPQLLAVTNCSFVLAFSSQSSLKAECNERSSCRQLSVFFFH
ncbi:MAG: hypothetical protein WBE52_09975, partial [Terriglobales bacterium]